ncbi:hypothetical protein AABM34_10965 [Lysinibacillus fusiformis]
MSLRNKSLLGFSALNVLMIIILFLDLYQCSNIRMACNRFNHLGNCHYTFVHGLCPF